MLESYIRTPDGKDYVDVDCVREVLGIKEEDESISIFPAIKKLREDNNLLEELHANHISQLNDYAELAFELGIESGDAESIKDYIISLKKERDELKRRANAMYGSSCRYSGDKAPAFLCDVISYSWSFGAINTPSPFDSIRVELNLTPTANYKGTFDMEDLKKYIQEYGREKKLGIIESVDYQNAKAARAELAYLYKTVLGKERLDRDLSPHEVMNDILDEYKRVRYSQLAAQHELDRYRLAVGSLLDISEEASSDINAIERVFTFSKKNYALLKEFRNDVCEIFDIPSNMTDEQVLKEIHDITDRYDELEDFRADICGALDIDGMLGTPKQNDKYILEQVEKLKDNKPTVFRNDVAVAIGMTTKDSNPDIIKRVMEIRESHDKLARLRSNICTALCLGHEDCDGNIIGRIHMMQDCHDKLCKDYTELRKAIWESMDRNPETLPEETARLVGEVRMLQMNYKNMHDLFVDYGAAQKILSDISDFRKWAIEELKQHGIVENDLEHPENIDVTGSDIFRKLLKRYDWAYGEYKEQYRLRQGWHARYESEHERANGEHKRAEKALKEVETLKRHRQILENDILLSRNEQVGFDAFRNECRKLKEEKAKVISALGQDIWDDCVK